MNGWAILSLGFLAQGLFSARFLVQLVKSEKAGKVLSPVIFWQLSLVASFLLMVYGSFRHDIVIVGGQMIGYFVYIRNLQIQKVWQTFPISVRLIFFLLPVIFFVYSFFYELVDFTHLLDNPEISGLLLTWGSLGQIVFTGRFLIQWYQSEKNQESVFPQSFWYISIVGALMIASYAIIRNDAILFIGQSFGLLVYVRNIMIHNGPENLGKLNFLDRIKEYRLSILLGFTGLVLFFNLNAWSVTESSEARYAQISKEMLVTGDWIHPQLMEIYHYHKPPMTYWITALSYKIFGVTPFAARFFLQISILLQIYLVFLIGKLLLGNGRSAFMAAMLYASFPVVITGGRALTTDSYLMTFLLFALFFWFSYLKNKQPVHLIATYLFLGLGFLTKGPVILIVPGVLWIFHLIQKGKKPKLSPAGLVGILSMLIVGFSWFVWLYMEDARFLDYFVFKHTIERFASDTFSRSQPIWFYPAILLITAFPWFLILLGKTGSMIKDKKSLTAFFWVWVCVPVLFFSVSQSKLVLYILPVFGGLALGAVHIWEKQSSSVQKRWEKVQLVFQLLILGGLVLAPLFDQRLILNYKFLFIWVILICLLIALLFSGIRRSDRVIISAWVFTMGITAMSTYFFSQNPEIVNDTRRVVTWIEENSSNTNHILIFDKRLPSVSFQTDIPIISIYAGDESLNRETQFQKDETWKKNLVNLKTDPNWIFQPENSKGIWLAKAKKTMPDLGNFGSWVILQEIDGWKIMRINPSNKYSNANPDS